MRAFYRISVVFLSLLGVSQLRVTAAQESPPLITLYTEAASSEGLIKEDIETEGRDSLVNISQGLNNTDTENADVDSVNEPQGLPNMQTAVPEKNIKKTSNESGVRRMLGASSALTREDVVKDHSISTGAPLIPALSGNRTSLRVSNFPLKRTRSAWAVAAIISAREILFLAEHWLSYHSALGCEHFYLYDYPKPQSISKWDHGHHLEVDGKNKHGVDLLKYTGHISDKQIADYFNALTLRYDVTIIPWSSPEVKQVGQALAYADAIKRFGSRHTWFGFFDMDEFVIPPGSATLAHLLSIVPKSVGRVTMKEARMISHWNFVPYGRSPLNFPLYRGSTIAGKSFVRSEYFISGHPHRSKTKGSSIEPWSGVQFAHFTGSPGLPRSVTVRTELKRSASVVGYNKSVCDELKRLGPSNFYLKGMPLAMRRRDSQVC